MRRIFQLPLLTCAIVLVITGTAGAALPKSSPRAPGTTSVAIPFSELGYSGDVSIVGPNPKFSLYVPVYPQLRSVRLRVPLRISPMIDRRSTITLSVNDKPVYTTTIGALGNSPVLDQTIVVPPGPRTALAIAVAGRFFRPGDICYDLDVNDFWMTVGHTGTLTALTSPGTHRPFIRDFLQDYTGRIAVVIPHSLSTDQKYSLLRLGYYLHQINRWRHTAVSLRETPDRSSRNIIFGEFPKALEVRGNDLYVNRDGIVAMQRQLDDLFITEAVQTAKYDSQAGSAPTQRTFADLGIATQTQSGIGDMPFMIPLGLSQIGGTPANLRLHIVLTHTPLVAEDRAYLKVLMNNTLVRSFEFRPEGGREEFDVPLDDDVVRAGNDLRIVPAYFNKRGACKGSYPRMTVSLLDSSSFAWDGVSHNLDTVGDFYNTVNGKVVALVADPSLDAYAFSVLDSLGTANSSIKQIDVKPYDGTIPAGYDYAVIVAAPNKLGTVSLPLDPNGKEFSIKRTGASEVVYRADYAQPFGVLEVAKDAPALVATYWKDANAAQGLLQIPPAEVAAQTDDIFIFNREHATYSSVDPRPHRIAPPDRVRQAMIPIIGVFILALAALVAFTARRARSVS